MLKFDSKSGEWVVAPRGMLCAGGIIEGLAAAGSAIFGAVDAGVGATLGAGGLGLLGAGGTVIASDALLGAGLGAVEGGITGGNVGLDTLTGAIGGAGVGAGGLYGSALGLDATEGAALGGAAAGALGSGITGGNPLTGALVGGASGLVSGALTPSGTSAGSVTSGGASATSAAPTPGAAAATVGGGTGDLTAGALSGGPAAAGFGPTDNLNLSVAGTGSAPTDLASLPTGGVTNLSNITPAAGGALTDSPSGLSFDQQVAANPTGTNFGAYPQTINGQPAPWANGGAPTSTLGKIGSFLDKNPGAAVAGGGLLLNLLQKQSIPGLSQLQGQAQQLSATGTGLQSYIQNGTLPPGMQQALDRQVQAQSAAIRSKYASAGMSGSSAEVTDLNNIRQAATEQAFTFADQLLQQGISDAGLSAQLYESITRINQEQNQQTGQAIAALAAALGGGSGDRTKGTITFG